MSSNDLERLRSAVDLWRFVQDENESHRELVSLKDWNDWETYNDRIVNKLDEVITNFNGVKFTEEQASIIEEIKVSVKNARRQNEEELKSKLKTDVNSAYNAEKQALRDKIM